MLVWIWGLPSTEQSISFENFCCNFRANKINLAYKKSQYQHCGTWQEKLISNSSMNISMLSYAYQVYFESSMEIFILLWLNFIKKQQNLAFFCIFFTLHMSIISTWIKGMKLIFHRCEMHQQQHHHQQQQHQQYPQTFAYHHQAPYSYCSNGNLQHVHHQSMANGNLHARSYSVPEGLSCNGGSGSGAGYTHWNTAQRQWNGAYHPQQQMHVVEQMTTSVWPKFLLKFVQKQIVCRLLVCSYKLHCWAVTW